MTREADEAPGFAERGGSVSASASEIPDCVACGGCCAWSETWPVLMGEGDGAGIPDDLIDVEQWRMQSWGHRCAALEGELGCRVRCTVYENRPLVCREFQAGSDDCHMVRRALRLEAA
ncbi:MAG: YkgJ family cysteine cluster protein [Denitratisoma sp.]|nr:YkgJ family cysteine cluster protein [Denitratisoma sp.]